MSAYVLGIDGCRSGWLTCKFELATRNLDFRVFRRFSEILSTYESARFIGVDIPIGLRNDARPRHCDIEARKLLAPKRSSCVFPAPPRRLLNTPGYHEACERSFRWFGGKISRQSFAIYPKVLEVDRLMNPDIQQRVFEVHPEVCFWRINGDRGLQAGKKSREGYEERRHLLNAACGIALPDSWNWLSLLHRPAGANRDDLLDAAVAAHVARQKFVGTARVLPKFAEVDDKGLRMEIIF